MDVSEWWSFMDQYGTGRIRRFVAVDQPAAVAAVPWMTVEEQPDSGAIFDVAGLMELGAALAGPDGEKTRQRVRGMFSGDPDPKMPAFPPSRSHRRRPVPTFLCCSTTVHRTGAMSFPESMCRQAT